MLVRGLTSRPRNAKVAPKTGQHDPNIPWSNRLFLKGATSRAHDLAENRWVKDGRFVDLSGYLEWLKVMLGVHCSLGLPAACHLGHQAWADEESARLTAISRDLGCAVPGKPAARDISTSWAFGVLYALNGSALGAATLLKGGGVSDAWPRSYLTVMSRYAKTGGVSSFFRQLNGEGICLSEADEGADAVFAQLQ